MNSFYVHNGHDKLIVEGVHSLMAAEKWNPQSIDWFHLTLAFIIYLVSTRWILARKGKVELRHKKIQIKTEGDNVFPGHCPQVVGQLQKLWKLYTANEKEPRWRRRQRGWKGAVIETRVNRGTFTQWRELLCCDNVCAPSWYVFPLTTGTWDGSNPCIFSTRSLSNKRKKKAV